MPTRNQLNRYSNIIQSNHINPFTKKAIPIYISDYVLAGYGTGAIMAVPAHDDRDWAFAKTFNLPIVEVVSGGQVQEAPHCDIVMRNRAA